MDKTHTSLFKAAKWRTVTKLLQTRTTGDDGGAFKGSGLDNKDFKKMLILMEKIKEDPRLPLTQEVGSRCTVFLLWQKILFDKPC